MKKNILALVAIASSMMIACDENNNGGSDNTPIQGTVFLPKKMVEKNGGDTITYTFTYDNENRLISEKSEEVKTGQPTEITEKTFSYSGNFLTGFVEKTTINGNVTTKNYSFEKQGNSIIAKEDGIYDFSLNINDKNQVVSIGVTNFTYDTYGNITTIESNSDKTTFTYDNKNGIFKNVAAMQPWMNVIIDDSFYPFYMINNIIKVHFLEKDDNTEETRNISIQYNTNGYPVKMTLIEENSTVEIEYQVK